jgi:hypothetical protein
MRLLFCFSVVSSEQNAGESPFFCEFFFMCVRARTHPCMHKIYDDKKSTVPMIFASSKVLIISQSAAVITTVFEKHHF